MRINSVSNKIEIFNNKNIIQLPKQLKHEEIIDSTTALKPLYRVMNILGERHNPNKAQWKKQLHSILLSILLLISGTFIVTLRTSSLYVHSPIIASTIEVFSEINLLVLVALQLAFSAFSSQVTDNKIKRNFSVIDSLLGIDTSDLYKRGKTTVIKLMTWHTLIFVLTVAIENYAKCSIKFLLLYCVEYFLYFMKCFLTLYFTSHLYFLKNQLFILNVQLDVSFNLLKDDAGFTNINGNTRVSDISFVENYLFSCDELRKLSEDALKRNKGVNINNLAEVYLYCCNQADLINFKCSIQNLLEINYTILALIRNFVYAVIHFVTSTTEETNTAHILGNIIYSLYDMVNLFVILSSCEFVKSEAKKTAIHLDKILHNCSENIEGYNDYPTNNPQIDMKTKSNETKHEEVSDPITALKPLFFIMECLGEYHNASKALWKKRLHSILLIIFIFISSTIIVTLRASIIYVNFPIITAIVEVVSEINLFILVACQLLSSAYSSPITDDKIKRNFNVIDSLLEIDVTTVYKRGRRTIYKLIAFLIFLLVLTTIFENYINFSRTYFFLFSCDSVLYFMKCFITIYFISHLYFLKNQLFILNVQLEVGFKHTKDAEFTNATSGNTRVNDISCVENYLFSCDELRQQTEDAIIPNKVFNINTMAEVYLHCCNQADLINYNCSIQNLLEVFYGMISMIRSIVFAIFYALDTSRERNNFFNIISSINFSVYETVNLFLMLSFCEFVKSEAKKTAINLENILCNYSVSSHERLKVEAWIELTLRRYPQFTACGLFILDYGLFYSILGTVMTYIVIVTQFEEY